MLRILNITRGSEGEFSVDYDGNGNRRRDTLVFSKVVTASGEVFETLGSESYFFNEYIGAHPELKNALFLLLRQELNGKASTTFPINVATNGNA